MEAVAVFTFVLAFAVFVFGVWCYVRILHRAGYSGWWVLLLFVPIVNIVMIWRFAFVRWPAVSEAAPAPAADAG